MSQTRMNLRRTYEALYAEVGGKPIIEKWGIQTRDEDIEDAIVRLRYRRQVLNRGKYHGRRAVLGVNDEIVPRRQRQKRAK